LVENVASFLESVVKSISAVGAMLLISPLLTAYSSAVVPAVLCGALFYGQFIKQLSRQHLDSLATSTHIAAERFGGIATVLSFGQKNAEIQRYSSVIEQAYVYARKVAIWEGGFLGTAISHSNIPLQHSASLHTASHSIAHALAHQGRRTSSATRPCSACCGWAPVWSSKVLHF
jgi:ABC-type multidrug transport system fused ATPase/permease subunit